MVLLDAVTMVVPLNLDALVTGRWRPQAPALCTAWGEVAPRTAPKRGVRVAALRPILALADYLAPVPAWCAGIAEAV